MGDGLIFGAFLPPNARLLLFLGGVLEWYSYWYSNQALLKWETKALNKPLHFYPLRSNIPLLAMALVQKPRRIRPADTDGSEPSVSVQPAPSAPL